MKGGGFAIREKDRKVIGRRLGEIKKHISQMEECAIEYAIEVEPAKETEE
jgi:hypothetical protein